MSIAGDPKCPGHVFLLTSCCSKILTVSVVIGFFGIGSPALYTQTVKLTCHGGDSCVLWTPADYKYPSRWNIARYRNHARTFHIEHFKITFIKLWLFITPDETHIEHSSRFRCLVTIIPLHLELSSLLSHFRKLQLTRCSFNIDWSTFTNATLWRG